MGDVVSPGMYDFSLALLKAVAREGLFQSPTSTPDPSPTPTPNSSPVSSPNPSRSPSPSTPTATAQLQASQPIALSSSKKRKQQRAKQSSKANRKRKRTEEAASQNPDAYEVRAPSHRKHVESSEPLESHFSFETEARAASTSYVGLNDGSGIDRRTPALEELVGPNSKYKMELYTWDGRTPVPITTPQGRVFGLLAGQPADDSTWASVAEAAANTLEAERKNCSFAKKQKKGRRGCFPALNAGIWHGGGRIRPGNLVHNEANTAVLERLANDWSFKRLVGFAHGVFASWAPRLFAYYQLHLQSLLENDPTITRFFQRSVWSAAAFNFGPRTICYPHVDFSNLPFGWCAIWALGKFDPKKGGHLILWELNLVIEFPPGSLVLIPSGVCRHSNAAIGRKETRYSFTQFSPGGIFRWVDHGFQTEEAYLASQSSQEALKEEQHKQERWQMGLNLLSTLQELVL
ncbi:hypothetical protein VKT23_019843 [Stygiomarasmius scandens]|uniref:Uncharacterized protein n=1 Tax=Marasmiellus scandens TaxID=2682957 RepID=A0ABR1IPS5_9AGAR